MSATAAPLDHGFGPRLDQVVDRAVEEERIVGAVILVARRSEILYSRAAGLADREAKKPMTPDAIFRLASVTKPFVATAALALVEAGLIGLADPVTRFIPEFRPKLADGSEPVITIRQLLTHTAGLDCRRAIPPCQGFRRPRPARPVHGREPQPHRLGAAVLRAGNKLGLFGGDGCAG